MLREINFLGAYSAPPVKIFYAVLSGILLFLAYPVFNLEFLAFAAFVPLFFALKNKNLRQAFFLSYLAGAVFWAVTIYWLIHVTLLGLILLVLYLSLYFGLFGILFKIVTNNWKLGTVLIPAAWVFLEWLRSKLITGFPWALLGYSQYLNLPFIQIADIAGVWGVSFLVMMVNVGVYRVMSRTCRARSPTAPKYGGLFEEQTLQLLLPLILLCLSLGYGYYKLRTAHDARGTAIKISVIQGNIPQHQKRDEDFRGSILERYETLTKKAARDNPDLIIWPETAAPGVIGEEPELLDRIKRLAVDVKTPILIGAVSSEFRGQGPGGRDLAKGAYYNSAILISQDGKTIQQYDKLHLVPFGEYVPLERHFPFLRQLIGVPIGDFTPGKEYTIFELKNINFAALICFEDTIPGLSRRFVKNGARFLVNITNDAWFLETSAPYQHAAASVFRAVENRVPVVRAANTGLSCFIDANGRIYDKVSDGKKDVFVVGYRTKEIEVRE